VLTGRSQLRGFAEKLIIQSTQILRVPLSLDRGHRIEPGIQLVEERLAAHFPLCHENHLS
jgi:hypothetical protein